MQKKYVNKQMDVYLSPKQNLPTTRSAVKTFLKKMCIIWSKKKKHEKKQREAKKRNKTNKKTSKTNKTNKTNITKQNKKAENFYTFS